MTLPKAEITVRIASFNVTDVHEVLKKVMDWGFVDVFRLHCKEPGQYTFWDYRPINAVKRNLGWRLDHIMATKPLAEKCTDCFIDKAPRLLPRPSDHTPIVAEFDWRIGVSRIGQIVNPIYNLSSRTVFLAAKNRFL